MQPRDIQVTSRTNKAGLVKMTIKHRPSGEEVSGQGEQKHMLKHSLLRSLERKVGDE